VFWFVFGITVAPGHTEELATKIAPADPENTRTVYELRLQQTVPLIPQIYGIISMDATNSCNSV